MSQQSIIKKNVTEKSHKSIRGQWDNARKLATIEAMISFRPFEQKYKFVQSAWDEVLEAVNKTSVNLHPLGNTAIKTYINVARKEMKEKQQDDRYATGTNDSESLLENRIRFLDNMMTQNDRKKDKNDPDSVKDRNKKRKQPTLQVTRSLSGSKTKKGKSKAVDCIEPISEEQENTHDMVIYDAPKSSSKSKAKKRLVDERTINQRRGSLDKELSAVPISVENKKYSQKQFLDRLESNHKASIDEFKEFTREILTQNNQMLQKLIQNQQQFFSQFMHLNQHYMAPPNFIPPVNPPPNHFPHPTSLDQEKTRK
ncbi:hypothetical protein BDF14DRAFT_1881313 [Spinellus fusiger]|nr:hypothetical protein BDF14DRAFT_1881313 [Spinellus fusiger]